MTDYAVFGGVLRSALVFPELRPAGTPACDWELVARGAPVPAAASMQLLGRDRVTSTVEARLYRIPEGFRLHFDDTGTFDVLERGRRLEWYAAEGSDPEAVRLDVLGRVLPLALHASGVLTLHGSAVALGGAAVAFVAPKGHGKSTLAQALVEAGGRLLSDDAVPVRCHGAVATTLPGVQRMRLWTDSAVRLAGVQAEADSPMRKHLVPAPWEAGEPLAAAPLEAVYVLAPVPAAEGGEPVRRMRLPPLEAAVTVVSQLKLGSLLGSTEAGPALQACAALAERVPVYRLEVARSFGLLPDVAECIAGWHGSAARRAAVEAR